MKETILINIPFTGLGLHNGYRGDDWFKRRIDLFHTYTLNSLLNQTEKDFIIWLSFRPEEKNNPLVKTIKIPHKHIFTYSGITIWDDKKENEEVELLKRIEGSLKELNIEGNVKLINLGSDDMYSKEVVDSVKRVEFQPGVAITHQLGYVYSENSGELAEWNPVTTPPFYALMIDEETFNNPKKHFDFIKQLKSHEYLAKMDRIQMPGRRYCVLTHNANISTVYEHPFKGNEFYYQADKESILEEFGQTKIHPNKRIIADELKNEEFKTILEVGCGTCDNLLEIEKRYNVKTTGIDSNPDRMKFGREKIKGEVLLGDARKLPFKDQEFDIAFTNALICMLEPKDVETAINELKRVAKKVIGVELVSDGTTITTRTTIPTKYIKKSKPIPPHVWNGNPWGELGRTITL